MVLVFLWNKCCCLFACCVWLSSCSWGQEKAKLHGDWITVNQWDLNKNVIAAWLLVETTSPVCLCVHSAMTYFFIWVPRPLSAGIEIIGQEQRGRIVQIFVRYLIFNALYPEDCRIKEERTHEYTAEEKFLRGLQGWSKTFTTKTGSLGFHYVNVLVKSFSCFLEPIAL